MCMRGDFRCTVRDATFCGWWRNLRDEECVPIDTVDVQCKDCHARWRVLHLSGLLQRHFLLSSLCFALCLLRPLFDVSHLFRHTWCESTSFGTCISPLLSNSGFLFVCRSSLNTAVFCWRTCDAARPLDDLVRRRHHISRFSATPLLCVWPLSQKSSRQSSFPAAHLSPLDQP